jgi:hypothetical protein
MQTIWERTIRRAGLPLLYSQGFHPGPKIQIASALPLGFIGRAEIVDIWLQDKAGIIPGGEICTCGILEKHPGQAGAGKSRPYVDVLQAAAPPGLSILGVEPVEDSGPALQTQMASAEYAVTMLDPVDVMELAKRLEAALQAESLPRERRGKLYNLRPLIEELSYMPAVLHASPSSQGEPPGESNKMQGKGQKIMIFMRLSAREGATGRPEEVLDVLGIPFEATRIERTRLILKGSLE